MVNDEDENLAQLLKAAGKRQEPAPEVSDKIRQATFAAWQEAVKAAKVKEVDSQTAANTGRANAKVTPVKMVVRKRSVPYWMAAAAAVVVGFMAFLWVSKDVAMNSPPVVAQLLMSEGETAITPLGHAHVVNAGAVLETQANGLMAIQLTDKTRVTLAQNTRAQIESAGLVKLIAGKIYVDSPDPNTSIIVATPLGEILDIGTQYAVAVTDNDLAVTMREGVTKITLDGKTVYGRVADGFGDAIVIDKNLNVESSKVATTDTTWLWTQKAITNFKLHNTSALDVLQWAGRVTGKQVIYATPETQRTAEQTHLLGDTLSAETISEQLPALLKTTTLQLDEQAQAYFISQ